MTGEQLHLTRISLILIGVLILGVGRPVSAEDGHDGVDDSAAPSFTSSESSEEEPRFIGGGPGSTIEERQMAQGALLRDAQGYLTPPPNFRTASQIYETRVNEPPSNPAAASPPAMVRDSPAMSTSITAQAEPDLSTLPTYAGGPPTVGTGYIGADLASVTTPKSEAELATAQAAARAESATAENERQSLNTYDKVVSAIDGMVKTEPLGGEAKNQQGQIPSEAQPAARRAPASAIQ